MTREQYFEMCEMMGNQPVEEEIPIEMEDLPDEVQEALLVYNMLQDIWDGMNGVYMGKQISGISDVFDIMGVDDKRTCFYIISVIDKHRSKILNTKKKPSK